MIIVLTTPRRPQYLGDTLRDLEIHGARDHHLRIVAVDGPVADVFRLRVVPRGWDVISVGPGGRGNREVFRRVCELALAGPGDLLFFEDDVKCCRNAVAALELIPVPDDCGFLQAFDHRNLLPEARAPMLLRLASDEIADGGVPYFWGNQAIKLPRRTLEHLARQRTDRFVDGVAIDMTERSMTYGADVWLGLNAASQRAPWQVYGLLAPSLFQHTGGVSAVNPHWRLDQQYRIARNWRADFDGLELAAALAPGSVAACAMPG